MIGWKTCIIDIKSNCIHFNNLTSGQCEGAEIRP